MIFLFFFYVYIILQFKRAKDNVYSKSIFGMFVRRKSVGVWGSDSTNVSCQAGEIMSAAVLAPACP